MYLAARRDVRRTAAAVAAGLLYGFGPYMIDQAFASDSSMVRAYVPEVP
jgi:hypothetical protein